MSRFDSAFRELNVLQSELQGRANRLWFIQSSLSEAYTQGLKENDFLPRRLLRRRKEEQREFETLIDQLNTVVSSHFGRHFIAFSSTEDVETVMNIRKTIRYIKNAYSSDPMLLQTLTKLSRVLQDAAPPSR